MPAGRGEVRLTDRVSPVVARRRLAAQLRRYRTASGRTLEEVSRALECSAGKVSRVENGAVRAGVQDVRALAEFYELSPAQCDELLVLTRQARRREWWQSYSDVMPPASAEVIGLEFSAATIFMYSPALVPGLLQTADYARAIMSTLRGVPSGTVERRVELRQRRQRLLFDEQPPTCTFVIDVTALDRDVGSGPAMAEQLWHLASMARRDNVTILLAPNVIHSATQTNFVIFGFPGDPSTRVVHIEHFSRNMISDDVVEVQIHLDVFAGLCAICHSVEESIDIIEEKARARDIEHPRLSAAPG